LEVGGNQTVKDMDLTLDLFERRLSEENSRLRVEMAQQGAELRKELSQGFGRIRRDLAQGFSDVRQQMAADRFELLKWAFIFGSDSFSPLPRS